MTESVSKCVIKSRWSKRGKVGESFVSVGAEEEYLYAGVITWHSASADTALHNAEKKCKFDQLSRVVMVWPMRCIDRLWIIFLFWFKICPPPPPPKIKICRLSFAQRKIRPCVYFYFIFTPTLLSISFASFNFGVDWWEPIDKTKPSVH